jgi:hypothetical protein
MRRALVGAARLVWRRVLRWFRRLRRANRKLPVLLLLDLLPWRDTPRDRLLNAPLKVRSAHRGRHLLEGLFAHRRPGRGPLSRGVADGLDIVFVMRHWGYVLNFENTLRLLAGRGHRVELVLGPTHKGEDSASGQLRRITEEHPAITATRLELRDRATRWVWLGEKLRAARDYLRYHEPVFRHARKLRARAGRAAPGWAVGLGQGPVGRRPRLRTATDLLLATVLRAIPPGPDVRRFVQGRRPDLLLVTPMVDYGTRQPEFVRAAREQLIPSGVCVTSWDNLTTKGLVHEVPDVLTVWNETQAREARELHRVPPDVVAVTGAHTYDHWFTWRPSRDRQSFCAEVALRADRPYVLYLCSSAFVAGAELETLRELIGNIRARPEPGLSEVGVLVRPHPMNARWWLDIDAGELLGENVVVWPRGGATPDDVSARSDYYDSIFYAAAVVGINTSALIESAIVGRQALSLMRADHRDAQEHSIHFSYLRSVGGGLVQAANDFDQHAGELFDILEGRENGAPRRAFVQEFLRPHGLDEPAAPCMVSALERAACGPVPRLRPLRGARLLRAALWPVATVGARLSAHPRKSRRVRDLGFAVLRR